MKGKNYLYIIAGLLVSGSLGSCASSDPDFDISGGGYEDREVLSVGASIAAAKAPSGNEADESSADYLTTLLESTKFPEGSVIFISQLGQDKSPVFPITYDDATENFYAYQYNGNEDATWEQGYNFTLAPNSAPIDWDKIMKVGSVGNAFNLYSLYFPGGSVKNNGNVSMVVNDNTPNVYAVTEWQNSRTIEQMKNYDVMGAYHATSSAYTRLNFRFFHLMVYVRVTLYVPVYDPEDGTGFTESAFGYSRFTTSQNVRNLVPCVALGGSQEHGQFRNLSRFWTIDYSANRSSDREGPLVMTLEPDANGPYGNSLANFYMHPHGIGDSHDAYFEEMTLENVREFYPASPTETERVRKYEFSAIIPPQKDLTGELMFFHLKKPGVGADIPPENLTVEQLKNYYFSARQLVSGDNDVSFTQGTMNHIELFIPRKANNVVKVKATILPWTETFTDMTLVDEDNLPDDTDNQPEE